MKKYLALLVLALTLVSCCPNAANYHVPKGYKTCNSNWDCSRGEYCGFVEIDSYAVCRR
jgi:hypothetical protein